MTDVEMLIELAKLDEGMRRLRFLIHDFLRWCGLRKPMRQVGGYHLAWETTD